MSDIKKLFKHSSHYLGGHILMLIAGFISFPIFTRVFTVSNYGIMSLISITLVFVTALAKLGINKGSARFYEEFNSGKRKNGVNTFYSTFSLGGLFLSGIVTIVYLIVVKFFSPFVKNIYILNLLYFTAILVWVRSISTIFMSFLNAEQKSKVYVGVSIFQKYGTVGLSIFFTFYIVKGLYGYYLGIIIVELLTVVFLISLYIKNINFKNFDTCFLKEGLHYGLPLIAAEFAGIILTYGDRYLLQYYLGSNAVGLYSAGYNLSTYCSHLLIMPFGLAIYPMYMKIWTNKGKNETKEFLSKALKYFLMFAIPIVFGVIAIGKELIITLASVKYSSVYTILPYIVAGILINGSGDILGAGLYISKKTNIITGIVISAGIVNIILNIFMIPKFGIIGAALATLIAYLMLAFSIAYFSFKYLPIKLCLKEIVKYLFFSSIMFCIIVKVSYADGKLFNLLIKIISGISVYFVLIVISTTNIRKIFMKKFVQLLRIFK